MKTKNKGFSSDDWLLALSVIYGVIAVTMNIFCMKSLSFGTSRIICDGGLLISWGVFLISNVIVEVWDEKTSARVVTVTAFVVFAIMVIGRLIVFIPTLPEYENQALAFARIFSNGPRTIIASVSAFWAGNLINVHIIGKMKKFWERRGTDSKSGFFFRAAFSTLVGQLADNALFMALAFAPIGLSVYEMAWFDIMTSIFAGTIIELAVESLLVPFITIPLVRRIKSVKTKEASV
ncbi:MAG: queuosine precursor transporter [Sphaerochaeta sp.]